METTPLRLRQIVILLFLRFCESASGVALFPFLNEVTYSKIITTLKTKNMLASYFCNRR